MALLKRSIGHGAGEEQDFELNIASIIDCFTVVITYLLVAASFISIGVLDVGIPGTGASSDSTPPPITISVTLSQAQNIHVHVSGHESKVMNFAAKDGNWDFQAAEDFLKTLKERWPDVTVAMVNAENAVEYKELVKAVETLRGSFPNVYIGEQD